MENKIYYYLKLKEDFYDSEDIKILESMTNGYLYSNLLMKLYLKSLKNGGKLIFKDYIPYDPEMIATITGHNKDVVEKALKIFEAMKLITILDNGTIFMLDIQKMIGSISSEGLRKQEYRERIEREKMLGTNVGQCPNILSLISNNNTNNNSLDNTYNLVENKEINNKETKETKSTRHKYGKYQRILLTNDEYDKLCEEFGVDYIHKVIERVDEYVEENNNKNKYKNFNLVIRKAIRDNWSCLKGIEKEVQLLDDSIF